MNLLLVEPAEVAADGTILLADRRAEHLRRIVGVTVGDPVKAGVVGGGLGTATVLADADGQMTLRLALSSPPSLPMPVTLLLAVPRPKVITRVIECAAAFGVAQIDFTNAWRVDKAYLASPRLSPEATAYAVRYGAEQGATTHLPPVAVHERLMHVLDARWPDASAPGTRLVAHPHAPMIEAATLRWPLTLAIGPEGGWIQRELDTFVARGFQMVSLGAPILRVESALAAALGQLALLERQSRN